MSCSDTTKQYNRSIIANHDSVLFHSCSHILSHGNQWKWCLPPGQPLTTKSTTYGCPLTWMGYRKLERSCISYHSYITPLVYSNRSTTLVQTPSCSWSCFLSREDEHQSLTHVWFCFHTT